MQGNRAYGVIFPLHGVSSRKCFYPSIFGGQTYSLGQFDHRSGKVFGSVYYWQVYFVTA
jgi:hypothetical protein